MSVLVDSNVLIDLIDPSVSWHQWSAAQVAEIATAKEALMINPIIYAEVSIPFRDARTVEELLAPSTVKPCRSKPHFWRAKRFKPIASGAVRGLRPCPTSSSALTP